MEQLPGEEHKDATSEQETPLTDQEIQAVIDSSTKKESLIDQENQIQSQADTKTSSVQFEVQPTIKIISYSQPNPHLPDELGIITEESKADVEIAGEVRYIEHHQQIQNEEQIVELEEQKDGQEEQKDGLEEKEIEQLEEDLASQVIELVFHHYKSRCQQSKIPEHVAIAKSKLQQMGQYKYSGPSQSLEFRKGFSADLIPIDLYSQYWLLQYRALNTSQSSECSDYLSSLVGLLQEESCEQIFTEFIQYANNLSTEDKVEALLTFQDVRLKTQQCKELWLARNESEAERQEIFDLCKPDWDFNQQQSKYVLHTIPQKLEALLKECIFEVDEEIIEENNGFTLMTFLESVEHYLKR
ncbi:hypothetical protein FGO68_gene1805 [Halteria grandinella]|uniref:Uncharacterized protein n=1 Tax=Halteria grandinella TaxID=5974 RepID=A0A8J8NQP8_HALGN|nr:hypothetical protein FGO68_gene1805 [Halteria grandinella]